MRIIPTDTVIDVTAWKTEPITHGVRYAYPNPDHKQFWNIHGFLETNDHAVDVLDWYGLRMIVQREDGDDAPLTVHVSLTCSLCRNPRPEALAAISAVAVVRPGEPAYIPLDRFSLDSGMGVLTRGVTAVDVAGETDVRIERLEFVAARDLLLGCNVRGKALDCADPAARALYDIDMINVTDDALPVLARIERHGSEVMPARLLDADGTPIADRPVTLAPHEHRTIQLEVASASRIAPLGREDQHVTFSTDGGEQRMTFVTVNNDDDYRTTLRKADIAEIQEKIRTQEWAKTTYRQRYEQAERWQVPAVDPHGDHLFYTRESDQAYNCALITLISGEMRFAEKTAAFLRIIADPELGYMRTLKGGSQELVHEGEFFKFIAMAYDHIRDLHLMTEEESERLHQCFRIFMEIIRCEMLKGKMSNWQLCELQGVIECAAEMQDLERIDHFMHCDGGILDHLSRGVLDDGWWYEASIGYNFLAMGTYLQLITCVDKWGYGLRDIKVPASYGNHGTYDDAMLPESDRIDGLSTEIWGPSTHNTRSVEQLVDSLTPFFGADGVIFGMNDAAEMTVPAYQLMDPRYDLAYRIYRKKEYLPLLATVPDDKRDLYYGVAQLPPVDDEALEVFGESVKADVAGIAMLRSRTPGRSLDEQYQVTVKSGILGGAHGHYDRLALNSIRRYGKNFYNPESIWYSYHTFMYKFYVQNSVAHNMALVDLKQQDPAATTTLAFETGERMQYVVQQITTRWCNPPYGGWVVTPGLSFEEQCWDEGRAMTFPPEQDRPAYASRSGFTEPIIQRRATVVTDDYVLLVDYLEGENEHQYDCLMHVSGLRSISAQDEGADLPVVYADAALAADAGTVNPDDAADSDHFAFTPCDGLVYRGKVAKLDPSLLSSGQFITDCHVFDAQGVIKSSFVVDMSQFNGGKWLTNQRSDYNAPGLMHMDVYSVAPEQRQVIVGCDPEYFQTQQKLHYTVSCEGSDGSVRLAEGKLGTWIFGRDDIDVTLPKDAKTLTLSAYSDESFIAEENEHFPPVPALFWGNGVIEGEDGFRAALRDLPLTMTNVVDVPEPDRDYQGGPVKLQMKRMTTSIPATPSDNSAPALADVDLGSLEGHGSLRLTVSIGADYPIGDEADRRRTLDVRTHGRSANFITLIEQHEGTPMVCSVDASDGVIAVRLTDGRVQRITVADMTLSDPRITIAEEHD